MVAHLIMLHLLLEEVALLLLKVAVTLLLQRDIHCLVHCDTSPVPTHKFMPPTVYFHPFHLELFLLSDYFFPNSPMSWFLDLSLLITAILWASSNHQVKFLLGI